MITMSTPTISAEIKAKLVGTLPTLHLRPNGTKIKALGEYLEEKLGSIPSYQLRESRYSGMVMQLEVYALTGILLFGNPVIWWHTLSTVIQGVSLGH